MYSLQVFIYSQSLCWNIVHTQIQFIGVYFLFDLVLEHCSHSDIVCRCFTQILLIGVCFQLCSHLDIVCRCSTQIQGICVCFLFVLVLKHCSHLDIAYRCLFVVCPCVGTLFTLGYSLNVFVFSFPCVGTLIILGQKYYVYVEPLCRYFLLVTICGGVLF